MGPCQHAWVHAAAPELHESCMPATEHLPAFKPWMKGAPLQAPCPPPPSCTPAIVFRTTQSQNPRHECISSAGSKKEGLDRKLSWIPSFSNAFSLSYQASTVPDSLAACVDATLARLQSASSDVPPLTDCPSNGSDEAPVYDSGMLPVIQEDASFVSPMQSQAARSSKDSVSAFSANNRSSIETAPWVAWVDSGEPLVLAPPPAHAVEHVANNLGCSSALLPTSEGGHRDSTGDTQPRNWYLGPGLGMFAGEHGERVTAAGSSFLSQPSGSFGGAAGGLMLQQVVCTSTAGQTHNLHSVPGNDESAHEGGRLHDS